MGQAELWLSGPTTATPRFEFHAKAVRELDPSLASVLLLCASAARLLALDLDMAMAAALDAGKAAEEADDGPLKLAADACYAVLDLFTGSREDVATRLAPVAELAIDVYGAPGSMVDSVESIIQLCAYADLVCDRPLDAIELLRKLIHHGDAAGLAGRSIFSRLLLVEALWRIGWWADALAEMSQLTSLQQAVGQGHMVPLAYAEQARLEAGMGQEEECLSHAEIALEASERLSIAPVGVYAVTARGLLHLGAGRYSEAAAEFDLVAAASDVVEPGWLWWQADYIESLALSGRTTDAVRAHEELQAQADDAGRVWPTAAAHRTGAILGLGGPPRSGSPQRSRASARSPRCSRRPARCWPGASTGCGRATRRPAPATWPRPGRCSTASVPDPGASGRRRPEARPPAAPARWHPASPTPSCGSPSPWGTACPTARRPSSCS